LIIKTKSFRVLPDVINAILYDAPNLASIYLVGSVQPISLARDEAEAIEASWVGWLEEQDEIEEETEEEEIQVPKRRRLM